MSQNTTGTKYLSDGLLDLIMTQKNDRLNPIVQILNTKPLATNKIRALISDGKSCVSNCMLTSEHIWNYFQQGKLVNYTVICLEQYQVACTPQNPDFPVLLIRALTIVKSGLEVGHKLASSESISVPIPSRASQDTVNLNLASPKQAIAPSRLVQSLPMQAMNQKAINNGCGLMRQILIGMNMDPDYYLSDECDDNFYDAVIYQNKPNFSPINVLTPFTASWTIRARVIRKSPIKYYQNKNGSGRYFNFEAKDETGQIDFVAFNEECDRFFNQIKKDQVYYISKGYIKLNDKQYRSNEYQVTLNSDSNVRPCNESVRTISRLPSFKFVPLSQLDTLQNGSLVDVIGVIRSVSPLQRIITRKKEVPKELITKEVFIIDKSLCQVSLTLWNEVATEFKASSGQAIAVRGASVSEFHGKKLNTSCGTLLEIDPPIDEARSLGLWFRNEGRTQNFVLLNKEPQLDSRFVYIGQISFLFTQNKQEAKFFNITAIIKEINSMEYHFYKSCTSDGCCKKVTDEGNNEQYFCMKCNQTSANYKWRVKVSLLIGDVTGSFWVTVFGKQAQLLFAISEEELANLYQNDVNEYQRKVNSVLFRQLDLCISVRPSAQFSQTRPNLTLVGIRSVQHRDRSKKLMKMIDVIQGQLGSSMPHLNM